MSHPILDPLREALQAQMQEQSIRDISGVAGVDYRKVLAFSQGLVPEFTYDELERMAKYLDLHLVKT